MSGEKFAFDGEFWKIEEAIEIFPKPIQKPHPPFYVASISPRSYEITARMGASLMRSPQFTNLDTVAKGYEVYKTKMMEFGHDPNALDQPFAVRTYVAPTDEEARGETENMVWFFKLMATLLPGAPGRPTPPSGYENYPLDPSILSKVTTDDVWERGTCFGSSERVTELYVKYMHTIGASSFMCQMRPGGINHKKVLRSMELFAKNVMPALREEEAKMAAAAGV